jgi:integrase/recombinase XerD
MLTNFVPVDRVSFYHESPYKARIDLIGQRLIEQRYLPVVTAEHVREWLRFTIFLQKRGLSLPRNIGEGAAQAYFSRRSRGLSASRTRFVRASLRIFLEADEQGRFRRRIAGPKPPVAACLSPAVHRYVAFLKAHRGSAPRTVVKHLGELTRFSESLERFGVTSLEVVVPRHVQQFAHEIRAQSLTTRMGYASTLRSFFGWAYAEELIPIDLRAAVAAPRRFKQRNIRDVLSESEVARILEAVDRSTVTGRRDYAALILAVRYGLRPCDIRQLQLDSIYWREEIIRLRQAKTGRTLTLPLLPDVSNALTAYLLEGRPATTSRYVFVRHRAPFEPFVASNNLAAIMRTALQRVGLDKRPGRRGFYLFRHTLANRMLDARCTIKSIGDVLGHTSTESTMEYASIDLAALRSVMISEQEVRA